MNNQNIWTKDTGVAQNSKSDIDVRNELIIPGFSGSFSLVEFPPKQDSENLWMAYFILSERIFREFNQGGRLPNRGTVKRVLSTNNPLYTTKQWMVLDDNNNPAAIASISYDTELSPDYESGSHICQIQIEVDPTLRRKKMAIIILKHMLQIADSMGKEIIRADSDNPIGYKFCKFLRGEMIHKVIQHRLYLEDVDWQLIDDWRTKGRLKFPGTKFESFRECPDMDLDEFCKSYTEIINQRPVGDIEEELVTTPESRRIEERNFRKREIEWHTMISREPDGQISAMTDIMHNPREPYRIHQYFTGVLGRYRRRGLAKRLKAEMLSYIKERFPDAEYVTTSTAKENKPMRAINRQLGFLPRKIYRMFRWELQDLVRRVNKVISAAEKSNSLGKKQ